LNLVDSSGWLEYFTNSANAFFFAPAIEDEKHLPVPAISIYEVFKKLLVETDEGIAIQAISQMQLGKVIPLDESLAINAAKLGNDLKLALANSIILATAYLFKATLFTQDDHFKNIHGVKFIAKKK
jgi:toxin FitB